MPGKPTGHGHRAAEDAAGGGQRGRKNSRRRGSRQVRAVGHDASAAEPRDAQRGPEFGCRLDQSGRGACPSGRDRSENQLVSGS
jgi:hypothetical protein